jgi:hypothetical protein
MDEEEVEHSPSLVDDSSLILEEAIISLHTTHSNPSLSTLRFKTNWQNTSMCFNILFGVYQILCSWNISM